MMNQSEIEEHNKADLEHRDMLLNLKAVMGTDSGRHFLKYLFKTLGVLELPDIGVTGELLHERLGMTRTAMSIFDVASQANSDVAAKLLAEIEREKYERSKRQRHE